MHSFNKLTTVATKQNKLIFKNNFMSGYQNMLQTTLFKHLLNIKDIKSQKRQLYHVKRDAAFKPYGSIITIETTRLHSA